MLRTMRVVLLLVFSLLTFSAFSTTMIALKSWLLDKTFLKKIFITPVQLKRRLFLIVLLLLFATSKGKYVRSNHFDYFIFSQRWLPSACVEFIENNSSSNFTHHCILPKNFEVWVIHGLWPTQDSHMGPFFCNRSMIFDLKKLQPIASDLRLKWPNIEAGKSESSLWQHEWDKHGTCAAQLKSLNSEIKYFNTTLHFFKTYCIQDLFTRNNIFPSFKSGIIVSDIFHLIKKNFGKMPQIHCIHEVKSGQPYLSEIRLCYSKNLELMDCGNMSNNNKFNSKLHTSKSLTNCPLNRKIILPDVVNPEVNEFLLGNLARMNILVDLLQIIRFLQWVSI